MMIQLKREIKQYSRAYNFAKFEDIVKKCYFNESYEAYQKLTEINQIVQLALLVKT